MPTPIYTAQQFLEEWSKFARSDQKSQLGGYSDVELDEIEGQLGQKLPIAYREFLKLFAHHNLSSLSGMNMDWDPEYTVWMRENAIEFTGHDPFPLDAHVFIEKDNHYDYFLLSDSSDNPRTFHWGYNGPGREIAHFETEGIWFIPTYILEEYKKGNYRACV